jgi:1-phosphofructokinase
VSGGPRRRAPIAVLEPAPLMMVAVQSRGRGGRPEVQMHAGGQGFWVARMAAEMGGAPVLCTPLGGRSGALTRDLIEMDGVRVETVECHRSSGVWISTGRDGDAADVVHTSPPPLDRHEVDRLYNVTVAAGLEAGVAVLTGLSPPGVMQPDAYRRLAADLRANGATVVADLSVEALGRALAGGVDLLKISHEELISSGRAPDGSLEAILAAMASLRRDGARAVVVSRAAEPALAHLGAEVVELVPPRLEALNPRGAGDAMTGTLAAGVARGLEREEVLRLAVAAGALNVTRRGLGTGERHAVERLARAVALRPAAGA